MSLMLIHSYNNHNVLYTNSWTLNNIFKWNEMINEEALLTGTVKGVTYVNEIYSQYVDMIGKTIPITWSKRL